MAAAAAAACRTARPLALAAATCGAALPSGPAAERPRAPRSLALAVHPSPAWRAAGRRTAWAQPLPDERPFVQLSRSFIADAASAAAPAVVNIQARPRGVLGAAAASAGSGFLIDGCGLVVTNAHVVQRVASSGGEIVVTLWNGQRWPAAVHSSDTRSDIALVQIKAVPGRGVQFTAAKIGTSSRLRAGDFVVALGSPLNLGRTVTAGIVSSTARHASEIGMWSNSLDYIQTDAAINQGNSGGPLVNLDGEVIGVCTMKAGNSDGIAFAVPIDAAWPVVRALLKDKRVLRPYVGIKFRLDHNAQKVMVDAVLSGSPAAVAGIEVGDCIVSVDGHPVSQVRDILNRTGVSPGQHITLELEGASRDRRTVTVVTAAQSPGP